MDRVLPQPAMDVIGASIDFVYQFAPLAEKTVVLGKIVLCEKIICHTAFLRRTP